MKIIILSLFVIVLVFLSSCGTQNLCPAYDGHNRIPKKYQKHLPKKNDSGLVKNPFGENSVFSTWWDNKRLN